MKSSIRPAMVKTSAKQSPTTFIIKPVSADHATGTHSLEDTGFQYPFFNLTERGKNKKI